jgi:hypothetical protein
MFPLGSSSALTLLVTRVLADHPDAAVPTDDLALLTDFLDARTNLHDAFGLSLGLLVSIGDTTAGEVVGGEFDLHLVARENSDVVHPHFSRDVRQHFVAVLELHPEHCIGERFEDRAFEHDGVVFWLGQGGPLSKGDRSSEDLLRTREADLGRGAMLSPAYVNAKWLTATNPLRTSLPKIVA